MLAERYLCGTIFVLVYPYSHTSITRVSFLQVESPPKLCYRVLGRQLLKNMSLQIKGMLIHNVDNLL